MNSDLIKKRIVEEVREDVECLLSDRMPSLVQIINELYKKRDDGVYEITSNLKFDIKVTFDGDAYKLKVISPETKGIVLHKDEAEEKLLETKQLQLEL